MPKRYVLYEADAELNASDLEELARILGGRHGKVKAIAVAGNGRAVIIKTTADVASELRGNDIAIRPGGKRLTTVLTSGAIGKLKRRAKERRMSGNDKVPKR
jgi:hypothetical protein